MLNSSNYSIYYNNTLLPVFSILILLSLSSCGGFIYEQATNKLDGNMDRSEVISRLGTKPFSKKLNGNSEVMVYYTYASIFDLIFCDRFPYFGFYPFNVSGQEFWIVLENGKVSKFGYAKNFGNSLGGVREKDK